MKRWASLCLLCVLHVTALLALESKWHCSEKADYWMWVDTGAKNHDLITIKVTTNSDGTTYRQLDHPSPSAQVTGWTQTGALGFMVEKTGRRHLAQVGTAKDDKDWWHMPPAMVHAEEHAITSLMSLPRMHRRKYETKPREGTFHQQLACKLQKMSVSQDTTGRGGTVPSWRRLKRGGRCIQCMLSPWVLEGGEHHREGHYWDRR